MGDEDPSVPLRPLSPAQLKVLHNLALGRVADYHISGAAQRGALGQTMQSLHNHRLLKAEEAESSYGNWIWAAKLTMRGFKAHQRQCCKGGLTHDDMIAAEMEESLKEKPDRNPIFDAIAEHDE